MARRLDRRLRVGSRCRPRRRAGAGDRGHRGDPALSRAGTALAAAAVLDHETTQTGAGRILLAGSWATTEPYGYNPSYASPAATADPADIVLITRRPESLADFAARGIEVRRGDFDEPDTLSTAFAGVDRLLLVSTDTVGHRLAGQRAAVQPAVAAGVSHVLYTSFPRPTADNPAGVVPDHAGTEDALAASGLSWTALRNNLYADMQQPVIDQALAGGQLVTNAGDGAKAYVSRADCAAAAVGALVHGGELDRSYDVTGPSAVTARDLADLASELGGRPVEVVQLDDETYAHGLESAGLPTAVATLLTSFGTSTRLGFLAETTDAVSVLSGRAPMSLRDVLRAGTASAQ